MHPLTAFIIILFVFIATLAVVGPLFWAIVRGEPYMPSKEDSVDDMLALADLKPGDSAADLGSGDGRLVIALAQRGIKADGYEINPWLVWWSRFLVRKSGTHKNARIFNRDFWHEDFSQYSVIFLYILPETMKKLEPKLQKELKPGARIISNTFTFPTWKPAKQQGRLTLYKR